jgi:hypothetical protein
VVEEVLSVPRPDLVRKSTYDSGKDNKNAVRDDIPKDRMATVSDCQIEHLAVSLNAKAPRQPNLYTVVLSEVPAKKLMATGKHLYKNRKPGR